MSTRNDLIAELVRTANEVEKLGSYEMARLLERAVTTIRNLRHLIGIPSSRTAADAVIDLQIEQGRVMRGDIGYRWVEAALLDAADMIRTLHIVQDTGTVIEIGGGR